MPDRRTQDTPRRCTGATAAEFDRVLHWPGGASGFPLAALIQDLNADGEERCFQIRQASAVWVQQGHALLDDYRATLCDVFGVNDDRLVFSPQSASFWRP